MATRSAAAGSSALVAWPRRRTISGPTTWWSVPARSTFHCATVMNAFVDSFSSPYVRVHFDTGNIMLFQHPEHWIHILGKRVRNTHFKEFTKKGTDHSLESFRPLLDGTTNWPAVMEALDATGYKGYVTFEYFHPYQHYPEALIWQTSDSL